MGPLSGIRVLELEAIGPVPFCGMMLADMGADVLRVERADDPQLGLSLDRAFDSMLRGRRSVTLDLKVPDAVTAACELASKADVLLEGFRPGVMERLGLGPDELHAVNPKLVYGRMTGWGRDGPLSARAGHDINYIALSGVLHAIGREDTGPVPPLNLVGDFGGGGMLLAFGVVCALNEAQRSGRGQVVDAAMADGAALLATMFWGMRAAGRWSDMRGDNLLDTGAPWYDVYATRDGRHVAVGAIEPKFYAQLLKGMGLEDEASTAQYDRAQWTTLRRRFAEVFASRTRDEWERVFADTDACVTPVLSFEESPKHPHSIARGAHVTVGTILQPAPAPRFSRAAATAGEPPPQRGEGGREALRAWGFDDTAVRRLQALGAGFIS